MDRLVAKKCSECGAPISGTHCEYCGTHFYDGDHRENEVIVQNVNVAAVDVTEYINLMRDLIPILEA